MEKSGKMRISVLGRSEGDGMENISVTETGAPKNWGTVLTQKPSRSYYQKNFVPSHGKPKEPKFVPYEPYKAAVSPIVSVPDSQEQKDISECIVDSEKVNSLAESIIRLYSEMEKSGIPVTSCDKCSPECDKKMKLLEDKISMLEKEKKELMSQYHVQTEVNGDLKKMLVAALGEDVQLKVQFMTEDKALLGKELLRLSEDLDESREEIEKLSIQCNVWESKFKASSLMVKELAQWKASLLCKLREAFRGIDSLLEEHESLFEQLCATHRILENTLAAFDARAKDFPQKSVQSMSISKLARELNSLSSSIQERLLGRLYCNNHSNYGFKYSREFTRAENLVNQILKSLEQNGAVPKSEMCNGTDLDPGQVACRALPHVCVKNSAMSFCKHCSGEIKVL